MTSTVISINWKVGVASFRLTGNNSPVKFTALIMLTMLMVAGNQKSASAQDDSTNGTETKSETYFNVPTKTLGGKQFWTDFVHLQGYRIQQNVMTGHHRLLDPKDVRVAWGNMAGCRKQLNRIAAQKELRPITGRVLIVMHGLTRTRSAMKSIADYVEKNSDATVINVTYASTRTSIDKHAEALASVINNLPHATEIDFLGHSMGSIVVRYYLGQINTDADPRFRRMVMLAPPNNGSRLAKVLQDNVLFKTFWGVSGQDLSRHWAESEAKLATPEFEFGIIAGSRPDKSALDNPLFAEENDLVVSVEETLLPGARDFMQQHLLHSTMMNDEAVHQAALSFFQNGYFKTEAERRPIPTGK